MATKKTTTGDTKKAAPTKPKAAKKSSKVEPVKTYATLGALEAAKRKRTAPKGITYAVDGDTLVFSVKGTAILTLATTEFVEATLRNRGFKVAPKV